MAPMYHSGNDQAVDVAENCFELFAFFGWLRRKRASNRARLVVRRNPQFTDVLAEIRDPISQLMKLVPEKFRRRVAEWLFAAANPSVGGSILH